MGAVYLVRHGQASFGKADYDQLSEVGFEQARVLGEALRTRLTKLDVVITGTMARHQQTADTCLEAMEGVFPLQRMAGFDEFDHDEILRKHTPRYADASVLVAELSSAENPRRAFQELFTQAVARWVGGQHDAEYSEPWPVFKARCSQALDAVLQILGPSGTALVFTSGGPVTALCQQLLHIPDANAFQLNWTLANCGVTKIIYSERGRYLSTLNEHAHFEGARRSLITYR